VLDADLDGDAIGVRLGLAVANGVALDGLGDSVRILGDHSSSFQCDPSPAIDLADGDRARGVSEDSAGLGGGDACNDPRQAGVGIPREPDGYRVRAAIGANGGEGRQVVLSEKGDDFGVFE